MVVGWVDAFNRRDADALVELSHPAITVHPTRLFRHEEYYSGHDGLRRWMADVSTESLREFVRVNVVRHQCSGAILVLGELVVDGRVVSPVAGLVDLRDGAVVAVRSYLSDEGTLRALGHIDL